APRLLRWPDRLDAHARDVLLLALAHVTPLVDRARRHVRALSRDEAQRVDAAADRLRALDVRGGQRARAAASWGSSADALVPGLVRRVGAGRFADVRRPLVVALTRHTGARG